jgi:hypothetical protein
MYEREDKYIYTYIALVGEPEGRKPLGQPLSKWKNNIKIKVQQIEWDCLSWVYLALD